MCGRPDRYEWEPLCSPKKWRIVYDGYDGWCPWCDAQDPNPEEMLHGLRTMQRMVKDAGVDPDLERHLRRLGRQCIDRMRAEAYRNGPTSNYYEVFLEGYLLYRAEAMRIYNMLVPQFEPQPSSSVQASTSASTSASAPAPTPTQTHQAAQAGSSHRAPAPQGHAPSEEDQQPSEGKGKEPATAGRPQ